MQEDLYNQPPGEVLTDKTMIKLLTTIIVGRLHLWMCFSKTEYQEKYKHCYTVESQEGSPAAFLRGALLPPHNHQAMQKGWKHS